MKINRRNFFAKAGIGTAALGMAPVLSLANVTSKADSAEEDDDQVLFIGENIAVADTKYGKVKGCILKGIHTFLGIPYAAETSGKNRFMPPQEPEPWQHIRPAVFYGNAAPQEVYDRKPENYYTFVDHWNYDELSEDCLRLNVWTPGIEGGKKRPVIVWLHGGGFDNGNGIEQDGFHGANFSSYGDVVFCSVNHRLGPLGFADFSAIGGEKYKNSGNVGMLDIVAALKWVNQNIENFGGDPKNVTVMGQSGGGSKVCIIAAMPGAKGLVHKGVALSGSFAKGMDQKYSRLLGKYILEEAGLTVDDLDRLQELPWEVFYDLAYQAAAKMEKDHGSSGMRHGSFVPVADGIHLPISEFYADASFQSPDISMLFCTTFHEWIPGRTEPELEEITLEGVKQQLEREYGEKAGAIVEAYAKSFPNDKPIEIWGLIKSNRLLVIEAANNKLKQKSPLYMAWFGWESPLFDHRMRSFHCLDISFWLLNTDLMLSHTGGGTRPRKLSYKMADALLNFMKKGNPNCNSLPHWPKYTQEKGETMILNDDCLVRNDPDRAARNTLT